MKALVSSITSLEPSDKCAGHSTNLTGSNDNDLLLSVKFVNITSSTDSTYKISHLVHTDIVLLTRYTWSAHQFL